MNEVRNPSKLAQFIITSGHGFVGWAYCGAIIGVGRQFLSMPTTLVVHAIGAPVGFCLLSVCYFRRFSFLSPVQTAAVFLGIVVALDMFLVAPVFERSFAMFASVLDTWVPFASIFAATLLTGWFVKKQR